MSRYMPSLTVDSGNENSMSLAQRQASKKFRKNHPEYWKKYVPSAEYIMHAAAKSRAKKKGIDFNLELSDVIIPEFCPVFGVPLEKAKGKSATRDNSPSLDRIHPEKGYVKGNVWVISNKANTIKSNATIEELEHLLSVLRSLEKK
jgi:hypothetical protein